MNIKHEKKVEAAANHKASIVASLQHRMEVARTNNDSNLLAQLEREMKQLGI